jgi:hypothetical protein
VTYSGGGVSLIIDRYTDLCLVVPGISGIALAASLSPCWYGYSITSDRQITGGRPALSWPKYLLAVSTIAADVFERDETGKYCLE